MVSRDSYSCSAIKEERMETKILERNDIAEAASILKSGEVIAFPTETVYGLGAIANGVSFEKLVKIKGRPEGKPFTLMISNFSSIAPYVEFDAKAIALMHRFMPGEITVLLPAKKGIPDWVNHGSEYVGIRMPNSQVILDLIDKVGSPLLVPSANKSGEPALTTFEAVFATFNKEIAAILKGECVSNKPSTIIKIDKGNISLIREGNLRFSQIKDFYDSIEKPVISLGCDHGGFEAKEAVKEHLEKLGFSVLDEGTHSKESCDYPLFAIAAAKDIAEGRAWRGVLVCTSGEGVSIAANKVKGIRCGIGYDDVATGKCVEHNNCQMVAFGQAYMALADILNRVDRFVIEKWSTKESHHRRVGQISEAE